MQRVKAETARLVAALGWFWFTHGHAAEGRARLERALAAAPAGPPAMRARALAHVGLLASQQADTKRLSEQVATLTESIDGLRQSFASARSDDATASVRKPSRKKVYRSAQRKRASRG